MQLCFTVFLLLTIMASFACAEDLPEFPELDTKGMTRYEVTRVVDGDTIKVDYEGEELSVRIIGVDTPETVHPRKPVEYYGKEASAFTTNLLEDTWVYLEVDQDESLSTDRYGRLLAHVWTRDGALVAFEIIRQGYGHYYGTYPFREAYMDVYRAYEVRREIRELDFGERTSLR